MQVMEGKNEITKKKKNHKSTVFMQDLYPHLILTRHVRFYTILETVPRQAELRFILGTGVSRFRYTIGYFPFSGTS